MALRRDAYRDVRFNGYGAFHGNFFKKVGRKVGHALSAPIKQNKLGKIVGRVAQASLLPFAVAVKPITFTAAAVGRATGVRVLQQPDKATTKFWNYTRTHPLQILGAQAAIAAAAVAAAPAAAASTATATTSSASTAAATSAVAGAGTATASTAAATATGGLLPALGIPTTTEGLLAAAGTAASGAAASFAKEQAKAALQAITTGKPPSTPGQQPGQPPPAMRGVPVVPLAGAAGGFAVAGPMGAVVGGILGYFLSAPKGAAPSNAPSAGGGVSDSDLQLMAQNALAKAMASSSDNSPPKQMTEAQAAEGGV